MALEATRQLEAPVDEVLFSLNYPIGRKYAGWMVNPYVVRPDFVIESTIGHRKEDGGYGKLFKNPCYQAGWNKNVPFSFS